MAKKKRRKLSKAQQEKIIEMVKGRQKRAKIASKIKRKKEGRASLKKFTKGTSRITETFSGRRRQEKGKRKQRERATRGILTALGVIQGKQTYSGAGRPRGTYKHGVPIQVYKQKQREDRARYQRYQQEQYARLKPKGFSPEQIQQLQQQQTYQELEQPPRSRVERVQERVQQMRSPPINIIRPGFQKMRVDTNMHNKVAQPGPSVADEELAFRKWSSESTITPRTQRMLDTIRRIQNKGKQDNIEQQRRLRERNMVGRSMNLMKAHENMINTDMDFTGVDPEQNILMAPSVFKENPNDVILRNNRGGLSILNTREGGNDLHF